mmetsp:Transcript_70437/g.181539  ORF Transcript_70437/g.181539 Transcript_70437/m.181539 type:complete len:339 (-) Transcript_70437:707-1723(-)
MLRNGGVCSILTDAPFLSAHLHNCGKIHWMKHGAPSMSAFVTRHTLRLSLPSRELLLKGGQDVAAVRRALQLLLRRDEVLAQLLPLGAPGMLNHALHDEVAEAVVHHLTKRRVVVAGLTDHLAHQCRALLLHHLGMLSDRRDLNGLLHHVAGALVPRELHDVGLNHGDDPLLVVPAPMLEHVLHHVVAVGVLREPGDGVQNQVQHPLQLVRGAVLEKALHDAAAVHVRGHLLRLVLDGLDDERHRVGGHLLDALLDHVVAVHALDAADDVVLELVGDGQLGLARDVLDCLLDNAAAVRLVREAQELGNHLIDQRPALVQCADVEELLDNEIAEGIVCQ